MRLTGVGAGLLGCALGVVGMCVSAAGQDAGVQAGFYLVLAEGSTADALPSPTSTQRIVLYDYRFLLPEDRQPAK